MDKERDIIQKVLDGDAENEEKQSIARSVESDPELRREFTGLMNAVRMLEESERQEAPSAFTAEVMKRLPRRPRSALGSVREFLFGSRVLRWNMATALTAAVVVLVAAISLSRMHREPAMTTAPGEPVATVRLTFYSPQARSVAVAGEFNKWKTDADEMKKTDGTWSIDLKLKPGVYTYSFIVDGKSWVPDPGAESYEDDGFGSRNAVLRVMI
ncbi:MAG TPA: hypothetical protein VF903_03120 [Nitrospirota bacterium]